MASPKFKNRITVQSKVMPETQDTFGGPQEVWSDAFDEYADYQPSGSREFPTSWKRFAETTARFVMRSSTQTRAINSDKHRIVQVFDRTASPIITQTWNISPPYPVDGKPFLLAIEASEIL